MIPEMLTNRNIIHIDVTDFCVAVERVLEPRLRQRPVAVAIRTAARSLVLAASAEARQSGVRRGMPLHQALRNCPDLIVLPPNEDLYVRATRAMIHILGQFTPVFEPLRFGHAYMDMTGSERLFGRVKDAAARAQREIRQRLSLEATAGIASNKLVSKIASDVVAAAGERQGLCDVKHGYEENFLAPLWIGYLPGLKKKIREPLLDLNVRLIRELAEVSPEHLQMLFGRFGLVLWQRAHGIDPRPVQPPRRAPQVVEIETLERDSNDYFLLRARLFAMVSRAARRLRRQAKQAGRLTIEIRYSDHKEDAAQQRFVPTNEEIELVTVAEAVLERVLRRRVRIRRLTLRLGDLTPIPAQLTLFDRPQDPRRQALTRALDRIRDRYGEDAIRFGRAA